ncbi:MAG: DUF6010 family protein [Planctomycetota bacterium]
MALAVIMVLYVSIGLLAAAGAVLMARRLFSPKAEQIFFALFLGPIAAFYLAFTAYFGVPGAWRLETSGVIAFSLLGLAGTRWASMISVGYALHGVWDILHELHAHSGVGLFGAERPTEIPLAYGAFCLAYDWLVAGYAYRRRKAWSASGSTRPAVGGSGVRYPSRSSD